MNGSGSMYVGFLFGSTNMDKSPRERYYKIIDTDFEEVTYAFWPEDAVMKVYEARNLPVAKNVMLCLIKMAETSGVKVSDFVDYENERGHQRWLKYRTDVERLMLLL